MKSKIKIVIADDHPIFRHGLCSVIESSNELELVGEADNGKAALQIIEAAKPDIVILDINMPVMDGFETLKSINKNFPQVKTIILTLEKDPEIFNALKAMKVKGYLLKDSAVLEIVNCIKIVASGSIFIDPEANDIELTDSPKNNFANDKKILLSKLTQTEFIILKLIANSKTSRDISEELKISVRTTENHRLNICSKLFIKGNHSLLKFALENKELILSE